MYDTNLILLAANCYGEKKKITQAMQEAMVSMQGLNPVEHETLPLFKGEKVNTKDGFYEVSLLPLTLRSHILFLIILRCCYQNLSALRLRVG